MTSPADISCKYRTESETGPLCHMVSDISGLPLLQCGVFDDACRSCLASDAPPELPNPVVSSMVVAAAIRLDDPAFLTKMLTKVTPYVTQGKRSTTPRVTAAELPCIHRGDLLRTVDCELCGIVGTKVEVHHCNLPGASGADRECTPGKWSKTGKHPRKACLSCESRQEPVQIDTPSDRPYLSIVMPTFDDWDGVWFTTQIIRSFFGDVLRENKTEIVCLDTNPGGKHGECSRRLFKNWCNGNPGQGDTVQGRYIAAGGVVGPAAAKQRAIESARGEVVLCIDCHLILQPGCLDALVKYFRENPQSQDLIQGPYLRDDMRPLATHMAPVWGSDNMKGVWAIDERALDANGNIDITAEPFEIPQMGMGFFACRREAWLGFSPHFRGFAVEEGYIHEKYRQAGHRTLCHPGLRWLHRTDRVGGAPYVVSLEDRFRGYLIRAHELGEDPEEYLRQFARTDTDQTLPLMAYGQVIQEVQQLLNWDLQQVTV